MALRAWLLGKCSGSENGIEFEAQVKEKRRDEMERATFVPNAGDYKTEPLMVGERVHNVQRSTA
jgi:hypothetical protein